MSTTPQELADVKEFVLPDEQFGQFSDLVNNKARNPQLDKLLSRPTRWANASAPPKQAKKKAALRLAIELDGDKSGKELVVSKVQLLPESGGGPRLFLSSQAGDTWSLLYTATVIADIHKLERIQIIRREEPLYRGLRLVGLDVEIELEVVTGLHLSRGTFQLDQLPSGKWRINYDINTIPDFNKIESFIFTVLP